MKNLKIIYIICFIIQVPSIILIGYLLFPISETTEYEKFYCEIKSKNVNESFKKEFKKLFENEYSCTDTPLGGLGFLVIPICIILLIILISYVFIIIFKMLKNGFLIDPCSICLFTLSLIFLLYLAILYIFLIPPKTSFDNPDLIFIFNEKLNKKIEEKVKTVVKRKIYAILGLVLILITIGTTIIKIILLSKAQKKSSIDEKLIINRLNDPIVLPK